MSVRYPAHLFIRIDRDLRAALRKGASEADESVSALARRVLRASVSDGAVSLSRLPEGSGATARCPEARA